MTTAQEQRDQDQTEEKSPSSVRPKTTAQERRDLGYLEGYGYAITGAVLSTDVLWTKTVAWIRGYNAGLEDWRMRAVVQARPLPIHRTEAGYPRCATCDGGGCFDCTDAA